MNYQDLFQCLKGVGSLDLSGLVLPIDCTGYVLQPIKCRVAELDMEVVVMLTVARNSNANSFLTFFTATPERTANWLTGPVAVDSTRVLFAIKELRTNKLYGYMGLAYGDSGGTRIEGDAIVRYAKLAKPGLMRLAFLRLIDWVNKSIAIEGIWIRVLTDNPAISFYNRCSFVARSVATLYEVRGASGKVEALTESSDGDELTISSRTLTYMKYMPSEWPRQVATAGHITLNLS